VILKDNMTDEVAATGSNREPEGSKRPHEVLGSKPKRVQK